MWKAQGHADRRCALPRRRDLPADHGLLIVASAVHRQKDMFFILVQSEMGDLYKVTLRYEDEAVHEARRAAPRPHPAPSPLPSPPLLPRPPSPPHPPSSLLPSPPFHPHPPPPPPHPFLAPSQVVVRYLDTIPVATSLCILKSGFLFGATESGNHGYYQVQGLGDDDDAPMCTSAAFEGGVGGGGRASSRALRNLLQVDEMESLCPLMDAKLLTRDGTPSLVALCGKSARSTLRTLTRGLAVAEMAVSELPGNPNAVWTVKKRRSDAYDAYIVVSFVNATLVLSIGETVEEVTDSGLKSDSPTVHVALVGDDSIVQVYPSGIRHIRTDGRVNEWRPPKGKPITHATANAAQVVIALSGGEVVYFELDAQQALAEIDKKDSGHEISCLEIGAVPPGRLRSRFVALGGWDNTMRVLSLDPDDCMASSPSSRCRRRPSARCLRPRARTARAPRALPG